MRASEILALEDAWVDGRVIHLLAEATKTRLKRDVALSKEALRLVRLARDGRVATVLWQAQKRSATRCGAEFATRQDSGPSSTREAVPAKKS